MTSKNKSSKSKSILKLAISFLVGVIVTVAVFAVLNRNVMKINVSIQEPKDKGQIVAKVDGQPIYENEINQKLVEISPKLTFKSLSKEDQQLIVKEVYVQKIITKNALKGNYKSKYSDALRNFAVEEIKNNYLESQAAKEVTDEQVKAKYQEVLNSVKGKKEYLVSHILSQDLNAIKAAKVALKAQSFEDAAKKFSSDTGSAKNGGSLGYILEGTTIKEFEEQFKKLPKDGVSEPFKTPLGWHIVKLKDIRDVSPAKFEDVKDKIKATLTGQAKKSFALKLVEKSKIEIL